MDITQRLSLADYRKMVGQDAGAGKPSALKKRRETPEEDLHRACIELVEMMEPMHPLLRWLTHVPNGEKRGKAAAGKLKAMGTKKGFPDLQLPRRCGHWTGLALELKSSTGGVSEDQAEWLDMFHGEGYLVGVCRTLDGFKEALEIYLSGRKRSFADEWRPRLAA